MERDELADWLRLSLVPGVGNSTARKLLSQFGLPASIFAQTATELARYVSAKQTAALLSDTPELPALLETTWQWLRADPERRRLLTLGDAQYPTCLLEMEDPPLMLYGIGSAQVWATPAFSLDPHRCLAVVGSRNPTTQGAANARQFSEALAQAQLTIISGLALGIDSAAHVGALEGAQQGQVATVAVVGTGLDRVYPRQNRDLAHRIALQGLILSEYPLGTPPLAANFPRRNRIISGLCRGTLVVEAALKSGSLITARLAVEQGRDVFAIPGSIHSTQSRGCHSLIKQGAKLVESAQDILEDLLPSASRLQPADTAEDTDDGDDPIWAALGYDPIGLDALLARTGMDTAGLQVRLMELELEGRVARLPGGLFQRLALS
ncbi:MAG: DNA-protecting protein DprA [Burkholderiales bacterium PBB3]|nr:MAG: DNA-protecting protein DprA [Burkholderiales bacterium PBB3]